MSNIKINCTVMRTENRCSLANCVYFGYFYFIYIVTSSSLLCIRALGVNLLGILIGTLTMELGGVVSVSCEKTGYHAELEFKLKV